MSYIFIIAVILILIAAAQTKKPVHIYTASFGDDSNYLSRYNHGFSVSGNKALSRKLSFENVALFGPTGSGKTNIVILSSVASLARSKSSMVFHDVSSEIYEKSSGYLRKQGYKIMRLDFSNSKNSESYNPLTECKSISDIQKVALLILENSIGETKGDIFWQDSSKMLISLFARYLIFHTEPKYHTLQNVLRIIEKFAVNPESVDKLIIQTQDEELLDTYKATVANSEKTLQSIIATTRTALNLFCDKEVCRVTANNSIDFNLFRNQPVALYVCTPLKDLMYFKPLTAQFFQSFFNFVLSRIPNKDERSIFFIVDEAATMKFPALSTTVSNIRKFQAGILLCYQDEKSLTAQYGDAVAHSLKTNCGTKVYLKSQPLHTCKELSQILGKYTYVDEEKNNQEKVRELMTVDEIRMTNDAIILINNKPPLKVRPVPYYENIWLSNMDKIPPYQTPSRDVIDPPFIKFN